MARKPSKRETVKKKSDSTRYPKRDLSKKKVKLAPSMKIAQKLALAQKNSPKTINKKKKTDLSKQKNKSVRKTHPTYVRMISEALDKLVGSRRGIGYKSVINYIGDTYSVSRNFTRYVKTALQTGIQSGIFQIAPIAKYRLSTEGRKVLRAPQRKKKPATTKSTQTKDKKRKNTTQDDSSTKKKKKKSPSSSPSSSSSSPKEKKKKPKKVEKKEKNTNITKITKKKPKSAVKSPKVKSKFTVKSLKEKSKYDNIWQYKENDGNWGDYELKASDVLEEVYQAYLDNREGTDLRTVKSGEWTYEVDFKNMNQTNVQHPSRTVRPIRRLLQT